MGKSKRKTQVVVPVLPEVRTWLLAAAAGEGKPIARYGGNLIKSALKNGSQLAGPRPIGTNKLTVVIALEESVHRAVSANAEGAGASIREYLEILLTANYKNAQQNKHR